MVLLSHLGRHTVRQQYGNVRRHLAQVRHSDCACRISRRRLLLISPSQAGISTNSTKTFKLPALAILTQAFLGYLLALSENPFIFGQ